MIFRSVAYKGIGIISFLVAANFVLAQNDKLGGWYIANLNYHPSKNIAVFGEVQTRSQNLVTDFYYHEFKAGASLSFNKNSLLIGFGDYKTYTFPGNFKTPLKSKEFRIWEQFVLNNNIDRFKIEHRYRIEQRWINGIYRDRFRYRLNPVVPINHSSVSPNTLYATVYDEVFFTSKAPYFERNRIFGGLGYQFSGLFTFQAGFIRQYDYRVTDNGSGKNFIQTSCLFNIDNTNDKRDKHPSTLD